MIVKGIVKGKAATALMLVFIVLCLASVALVRCQPESIEKDIEIECKWKGAPVSANLKWTEPKEDPITLSNANDGSKSKSGTTSSQANAATINTQQALMLTGASAGAALAGGGLLVKKKLEGSDSSKSETQTASASTTTSINSTAPKYTSDSARSYREGLELSQNELKSSSQGQSSTQTQQSNMQNITKDNWPPTTAKQQCMQNQMNSQSSQQSQLLNQIQQSSVGNQNETISTASNLTASAATITKDLLLQKQMDSLTKQSGNSPTSEQGNTTQQSKQAASSSTSTSTTSQNLGLLASSSSAARMAAEMWPQRQKEFEQLAKQRSELAEKFSVPSYCTGLAYSSTSSTGNAWARLQGLGSAIGSGIDKTGAAIKPYTPYITAAACITIILVSMFFTYGATTPTAPTILAGAGVSISIGKGAGLVGTGIVVTGLGLYAAHNLGIMNYPRQQSFEAKHTQIIEQSTSVLREEKGSGAYGEDVAQELLEQAEIRKDRIIQPESDEHVEAKFEVFEWLDDMEDWEFHHEMEHTGYDVVNKRYFTAKPDITSKRYIIECKTGREPSSDFGRIRNQAYEYQILAKQEGRTLVYWFYEEPLPQDKVYWHILRQLHSMGVEVLKGPFGEKIFGEG